MTSLRDDDLADFFDNGAVGLHIVSGHGTILRANKAELELLGYTADEYVGRPIADFHADKAVIDDIMRRLKSGEKLDKYPAPLRAKDGSIKHVLITSSGHFENGRLVRTRCFTIDVTEAQQARQLYRQMDHEYRQLLDALPAAFYKTDASGRITYFNEAAVKLAGRRPEIGRDQWCVSWKIFKPDGEPLHHDECPMAVALRENRPVRDVEIVVERPDGTRATVLPFPTPIIDESGKLVGGFNLLVDISERKRAEETQKLLIGELNHRVKNTLAVVQALAQQSARRTPGSQSFVDALTGRIQALARVQTILSATAWQSAELSTMIKDELLLGNPDPRILLSGPSLTIEPQLAMDLALVLHELATNARKYGGLSHPDGRLSIRWSLVDDDSARLLGMDWSEDLGSGRILKAGKAGFGLTLIETVFKRHGNASLTHGAHGVSWEITIPLGTVPDRQEESASRPVPELQQHQQINSPIHGKKVLIIEDEVLLGLDLSQMLVEAGLEVVGVMHTLKDGLRAVDEFIFDVALLDANLGGEPVDNIAAELAKHEIPFAFMTGYGRHNLPVQYPDVPLLTKPFTRQQAIRTVAELSTPASTNVIRLVR